MIPVTDRLAIDEEEIEEVFVRAGGPGGRPVRKHFRCSGFTRSAAAVSVLLGLFGFANSGNGKARYVLGRLASEKRQGTKSPSARERAPLLIPPLAETARLCRRPS